MEVAGGRLGKREVEGGARGESWDPGFHHVKRNNDGRMLLRKQGIQLDMQELGAAWCAAVFSPHEIGRMIGICVV